jgi:hypothetical protein
LPLDLRIQNVQPPVSPMGPADWEMNNEVPLAPGQWVEVKRPDTARSWQEMKTAPNKEVLGWSRTP